jgi:sterol desaturase/sphingolipid hydroxylase (fatty acid hydroxylase superfamily)
MTWVLVFVAGILSWTLVEYALHRFLGHDRRTWPNAFADEHTRHHSQDYFAPTWKKALAAAAVFVLVGGAPTALFGGPYGFAFAASFVSMYAAYELVHRRVHTHRGLGAWGRLLRRHHFHHHFANPRANFGVTSPFWDVVFGTREAPGLVRVPAKLRMAWLVDGAGALRPEFAPFYELVPSGGPQGADASG